MWRIVFRVSDRAFPGPLLNMGEIAPSFFARDRNKGAQGKDNNENTGRIQVGVQGLHAI